MVTAILVAAEHTATYPPQDGKYSLHPIPPKALFLAKLSSEKFTGRLNTSFCYRPPLFIFLSLWMAQPFPPKAVLSGNIKPRQKRRSTEDSSQVRI